MSDVEKLERKTTVDVLGGAVCVRLGVVGPRGGVELAFTCSEAPRQFNRDSAITADGFEIHSRRPMYDDDDSLPSHTDCWFVGGPCWHDGTTLWAREFVMPLLLSQGTAGFWPWLEQEYAKRFDALDESREERAALSNPGAPQ